MARLFPEDTLYIRCFRKQWRYIRDYLIDHEHGGWYAEGLDLNPHGRLGPKGFDWKVNYHESRALMQCIRMLRSQPEGAVE
jgi:mannobiose 2-epimerase